jgi:DNA-directed RNA polymerase subunit RPC12/RpoP
LGKTETIDTKIKDDKKCEFCFHKIIVKLVNDDEIKI